MEVAIAYVVSGTVAASAVTPVDTVTHAASSPFELTARGLFPPVPPGCLPRFQSCNTSPPLAFAHLCRTITFATLRSGSSLLLRSRIRCAG